MGTYKPNMQPARPLSLEAELRSLGSPQIVEFAGVAHKQKGPPCSSSLHHIVRAVHRQPLWQLCNHSAVQSSCNAQRSAQRKAAPQQGRPRAQMCLCSLQSIRWNKAPRLSPCAFPQLPSAEGRNSEEPKFGACAGARCGQLGW